MDDLVEILGLVGIVVILAFCLVVASSRRFRNAVINSGLYKKGFALHMNIFSKIHNKAIQKIKQELFSNMKPILDNIQGDILEIGSGTGANFAFFPEGSSVIALDPNPHMEKYLKNNADKFPNINITKVVTGVAEDLADIQDNSVAIVVCTLTLCSVQDIPKVLQEVKRVLKPGGCLYYLEHVLDEEGSFRRKLQKSFDGLWKYLSDGCSCATDTASFITEAGFSSVSYETFIAKDLIAIAWIMRAHIAGYAVK